MIKIRSSLSEKDKQVVNSILCDLFDSYSDFYLTKSNLRLPVKENSDLLFKLLSKGDKIVFNEEGLAIIIGYAEKSPRKYVKFLAKDEKTIDLLVKNINWNILEELYCKLKKTNPIKDILLRNRWKFAGDRGKEVLLYREKIELIKRENRHAYQSKD